MAVVAIRVKSCHRREERSRAWPCAGALRAEARLDELACAATGRGGAVHLSDNCARQDSGEAMED